MKARLWRGQKETVRLIAHAFLGSKYANQLVHLIIIGFDVVITDWPVIPKPINTFSFKIIRPKPQRNSSPMVGSSAQHSGAKPVEFRSLGFGVRFSLNLDRKSTRLNSSHVK